MRVVMTLAVRDEADVLPASLAFHLDHGVDFFVITDHRSVDETPEIIRQYELAGVARCLRVDDEAFDQGGIVTRMARMAATDHGAGWVIHADADEFWCPEGGDLGSVFDEIDDVADVVEVQRHDFVPLAEPRDPFHQSMIVRKATSENVFGRRLPAKVAHRSHPDAVVAHGNHGVVLPGVARVTTAPLEVLHFPFRRREQFVDRIVTGTAAIEAVPQLSHNVSSTWRHLAEQFRQDELAAYCDAAMLSVRDIEAGLRDGSLVVDRRVADHFAEVFTNAAPTRSSADQL